MDTLLPETNTSQEKDKTVLSDNEDRLPREIRNYEVMSMISQLTILGEFPGHGTRKGNAGRVWWLL